MSSISSSVPTTSLKRPFSLLLAVFLVLLSSPGRAVLTIEVTRGVEAGIPIAIVPFGTGAPEDVSAVVTADLARSGRFDTLPERDFLSRPNDVSQVKYKDWRLIKAEALVIGKVQPMGGDRYTVEFRLLDVFREKALAGRRYTVSASQLRKAAHQIADIIYETLTGKPGAFDTRIAYVTSEGSSGETRYRLQVADSDGYNPKTVLESSHPIMSPAWSPDGTRLAYVSFEKRRSNVFVQNIRDGSRRKIADHPGINSAPAWSPDGRRLAMTLSKDGNPEIYIQDLGSGNLQRITHHTSIDTEPAWSPDGRALVFTSDRSGKPQIYRVSAFGGTPQRLTFTGKYNARASFSPDGRSLVLITNQGSGFRVGLFDLGSRSVRELTNARLDESPSFAPNGEMILYATQNGGRNVLAAVSSDGRVQQTLRVQEGSVREPAWSPMNRKL